MRDLARVRVRYGYRKLHILLRREGFGLGRNLAYRLYREEGLQLRSKLPRRRKMVAVRRKRFQARRPNDAWSLDFVTDALANSQRFRALTVVDVFTRERAKASVRRQWQRVLRPRVRSVGVPSRRADRLQPTRQADGQRVRRVVQRIAARRVPEHELVRVARGGKRSDRSVAGRVQRESSSPGSRTSHAKGVLLESQGVRRVEEATTSRELALSLVRRTQAVHA